MNAAGFGHGTVVPEPRQTIGSQEPRSSRSRRQELTTGLAGCPPRVVNRSVFRSKTGQTIYAETSRTCLQRSLGIHPRASPPQPGGLFVYTPTAFDPIGYIHIYE